MTLYFNSHDAEMTTALDSICKRKSKTWLGRCSILSSSGSDRQCRNWEFAIGGACFGFRVKIQAENELRNGKKLDEKNHCHHSLSIGFHATLWRVVSVLKGCWEPPWKFLLSMEIIVCRGYHHCYGVITPLDYHLPLDNTLKNLSSHDCFDANKFFKPTLTCVSFHR